MKRVRNIYRSSKGSFILLAIHWEESQMWKQHSRVFYWSKPFIVHMKHIQLRSMVSNSIQCQGNKRNKSWKERSNWSNREGDLQVRLPYWAELVLPWQLLTTKERLSALARPTCASPNPSPTISTNIPYLRCEPPSGFMELEKWPWTKLCWEGPLCLSADVTWCDA